MYYLPVYYISGALFVFVWLVGLIAVVDMCVFELDKHLALSVTKDELRRFVWWQVGIFWFAFVSFKFAVLTGGFGYDVTRILSGHGSDLFAYPVFIFSLLVTAVGLVRCGLLLWRRLYLVVVRNRVGVK